MKQLSFRFMSKQVGRPSKISDAEVDGWAVWFDGGMSYAAIAERADVATATVFWHLKKKLGLSGRKVGRKPSLNLTPEEFVARTAKLGREKHLKRKYGLSEVEYLEMLKSQNGTCAICMKASDERLSVDHCHETNKVRGLLCRACNFAIGLLQDHPGLLDSASMYLWNSRLRGA